MDIFYIIVLTIAIVILILILTLVGIQISNKKSSTDVYPPVASTCPDYWSISQDGKSCSVKNGGKNGLPTETNLSSVAGFSNGTIDFTNSGWSAGGLSAICAQKKWADTNKITWDGVTNYNKC